jgi:hypothetical protein
MTMNKSQLQRFVDEAHNIVDGYIDNLPDDVSIDCAEGVILNPPHHTVIETESSVCVLAWISIPKGYSSICFEPVSAGIFP